MNLSMKQKQTRGGREQMCGCQGTGDWGRDGMRLELADANCYIQNDKQQGFTVYPGELYSVSYDKPYQKRIL